MGSKSEELQQRRARLSESLPGLSRKLDQTYRLSSDAQALNRAGVTHHPPQEIARLTEDEDGANAAIRDVQRELRSLDAEIKSAPGGGPATKLGRALRRLRAGR